MSETGIRQFNMQTQAWEQHNRFPAIMVKVLESRDTHPDYSMMVVQLAAGGSIDVHRHERETETAIVLSGQALFVWGEDGRQETLTQGGGVTIRPGTLHGLSNAGDAPLELLAIHSPPVR